MKYLKILVAFLIFIPSVLYAKEIKIDEYDIKININDEWDIFTRDNLDGNSDLSKYNLSAEDVLKNMEKNSIYIDAVYGEYELFLRANHDAEIQNLTNYKKNDIKAFAQKLIASSGADSYKIINYNDITYIKTKYIDVNLNVYLIEYVTIFNKNNITFTLQSYNNYPSKEFEIKVDNIIKSVVMNINDELKDENNIWSNILFTAIIGGFVGGLITIIGGTLNKRKKDKILNINLEDTNK